MRRNSYALIILGILLILSILGPQIDKTEAVGYHGLVLQDTQPPEITTEPEDLVYAEGTTGHNLYWEYFDENLAAVDLYLDGALIFTDPIGNHPTSLSWNVDGLSIGIYNYTLYLDDIFLQSTTSTVFVTVTTVDGTPYVSHQFDLFLFAGMPTNNVTWIGLDSDPDTYIVYLNGTEIDSGTWSSGVPIVVFLASLQIGFYNLTIVLTDDLGYSTSDTVLLYVLPSTIPTNTFPFLYDVVMIISIGIVLGGVVLIAIIAKGKR
ncbi:MAG: early set domain-containing protein [Candidatus Thorarchaeota archaeon SMTZ1-45]|nr:MAG: hypothetical protein AM325_10620 [Candidatus Thorarchaeota archaeon SMTZ1-45]